MNEYWDGREERGREGEGEGGGGKGKGEMERWRRHYSSYCIESTFPYNNFIQQRSNGPDIHFIIIMLNTHTHTTIEITIIGLGHIHPYVRTHTHFNERE